MHSMLSDFVVLGLGSNRDFDGMESGVLLEKAVEKIGSFVSDISFSSVYRTAPMYYEDQADFHNMVVMGKCSLSPHALLERIHAVEAELGRDREKEIRNGPRSMDIDIELFNGTVLNEPDLVIPHERLLERAFVMEPLLEILSRRPDFFRNEMEFFSGKLGLLENQRRDRLG